MITVGHIFDFVVENRGTKTFRGWTESEIAEGIQTGIDNETLFYATSPTGKVVGMILAERFEKDKVIFVTENLAMNLRTLGVFARMAKEKFPGYRLEAMRHDKHRHFNTEKLYQKLGT